MSDKYHTSILFLNRRKKVILKIKLYLYTSLYWYSLQLLVITETPGSFIKIDFWIFQQIPDSSILIHKKTSGNIHIWKFIFFRVRRTVYSDQKKKIYIQNSYITPSSLIKKKINLTLKMVNSFKKYVRNRLFFRIIFDIIFKITWINDVYFSK